MLKHRTRHDATVEQKRRRAAAAERLVPPPPPGTRTLAVDAGGVGAHRVATRASQPGRHVLYLHGGGFIAGSPSLYRQLTWRIASAARASVVFLDYRLEPYHSFPVALHYDVAA